MKDLDYYISMPYEVKMQELSENDGGGIMLSIPLSGEAAVMIRTPKHWQNLKLSERFSRDMA